MTLMQLFVAVPAALFILGGSGAANAGQTINEAGAGQPTTSSQGSIRLTKPPIASVTAPGTLMVLHPTQSATASGQAILRSPGKKQVISVEAMRTKWSQVQEVKDAKAPPNSGSAEVSPGHLDAKLPPGVEIRTGISGADLVDDEVASWTNPGGTIIIGAQGLTPGAVYALGCAFQLQSKGDTIQFNMGNQTTTLTPTLDTGDSVAFIAPPEGSLSISIKPSSSNCRDGELGAQGPNLHISRSVGLVVRLWHLADVQPIASRGLVPTEKRTCLISVWNVRS